MALEANWKSTVELTATLTDDNGDAVTGATVTLDVVAPNGTKVIDGASMSDDGSGEYSHTIAADAMSRKNVDYMAKITATSGSNERYAEVPIKVTPDAS